MPVVVEVALEAMAHLLALVELAVVVQVVKLALAQMALLTPVAVAAVALLSTQTGKMVDQAAQASSSLNTPHPHNPSSHSKVLPVG
jgi:hypothetical protein